MKIPKRTPGVVLGVRMDTDELRAVLVERSSEGINIIQLFREKRIPDYERTEFEGLPEMAMEEEGISLEQGSFVSGDGFDEVMMDDTVVSLNLPFEKATASEEEDEGPRMNYPIVELESILNRCEAMGYGRPAVVVCMSHPDVVYEEVTLLKPEEEQKKKSKKDPIKAQLIEHFKQQQIPIANEERLAYILMDETETTARYLAIAPAVDEPLEPTLRVWQRQRKFTRIRFWKAEAEISLYAGIARHYLEPSEEDYTLIVRVGSRDTLIIGLQGKTLKLEEHLFSLTRFDAVDTICRRVMLLLDEYAAPAPSRILVIDQDEDSTLVKGFQVFFPESQVVLLGDLVRPLSQEWPGEPDDYLWAAPACALAIKEFYPNREALGYEPINLLPPAIRRSPLKVKLAWHTYVVAFLLFASTFLFVMRYFQQEARISEWERRIVPYQTADFSQDISLLKQRVDSLQRAYLRYEHVLGVLDSLLAGSDRWSRTIASLSQAVARIGGIWVEKWTLTSDGLILQGRAKERDEVVRLAREFQGTIQSLWYDEIRGERIYSYTMRIRLPKDLPRAARYLREINQRRVTG